MLTLCFKQISGKITIQYYYMYLQKTGKMEEKKKECETGDSWS